MSDDQAYLDGFRDGLGAAIRSLDAIRSVFSHPVFCHALERAAGENPSAADVVDAALHCAAGGLRMLSASVKLDDDTSASQTSD